LSLGISFCTSRKPFGWKASSKGIEVHPYRRLAVRQTGIGNEIKLGLGLGLAMLAV